MNVRCSAGPGLFDRPWQKRQAIHDLVKLREASTARASPRSTPTCECDLYLTCAKFVTTPRYAPRLRERLCLERRLADDARERGWEREADRHERVADRLRGLLSDLGEPGGTPEDTP